jgi:acetyl-CoA C-acetyltransferase
MAQMAKSAAIVGVYEHPTRFAPSKSAYQLIAESARGALADAGLKLSDVDGLFFAGYAMDSLGLTDYLNIRPAYIDSTNIGGVSFVAHAGHAMAAIAAGLCQVALICYSAVNSSQPGAGGFGGRATTPADQYENPYGITVINGYAMVAQRHMHQYGTTAEQLAEIAVSTRLHASLNPSAKYRDLITVEDVINSRMIAAPLHLLDCCMISDGAGAVLITSAERARDLPKKPIYILGQAESVGHASAGHRDLLDIGTFRSAKAAYERAGLSPRDVDMAMVYDSFTITVLVQLEALGFCKPGEGGAFVSGGRLRYDREFPVNTDGGGLSSNHPGMRGIFLIIEAVKQLRGEGGVRQVKKPLRTAIVSGIGGNLGYRHGAATMLLSNE